MKHLFILSLALNIILLCGSTPTVKASRYDGASHLNSQTYFLARGGPGRGMGHGEGMMGVPGLEREDFVGRPFGTSPGLQKPFPGKGHHYGRGHHGFGLHRGQEQEELMD
jgi:hypothetical protein